MKTTASIQKMSLFVLILISCLYIHEVNAQQVGDFGTVSSGYWSDNSNWRTWDGNGFNTNPNRVPSANDNVFIRHDVVRIDGNYATKNLTINSNAYLTYSNFGNYTLTVNGDLTLQSNSEFSVTNLFINRTEQLVLMGSLIVGNSAIFDMQDGNNTSRICNVTFSATSGNQKIQNIGTPSRFRFRNITVNNGGSYTASSVDNHSNISILGTFTLTAGTWIQRTGTISNTSSTIGNNVRMIARDSGTIILATASSLNIDGALTVDGNRAAIYQQSISAPANLSTIAIRNSALVNVSAGLFQVWGRLRVIDNSTFNLSGGLLNVNNRGSVNNLPRDQNTLNISGNAVFNMTGGVLQIPNFNASTSGLPNKANEVEIMSTNVSFTGGKVIIGNNGSTLAQSSGFWFRSTVPVRTLDIRTGGTNNLVYVRHTALSVADSLNLVSGTLMVDSAMLTIGGRITGSGFLDILTRGGITLNGNTSVSIPQFTAATDSLRSVVVSMNSGAVLNIDKNFAIGRVQLNTGGISVNNRTLTLYDTSWVIGLTQFIGNGTMMLPGYLYTQNPYGIYGFSQSVFAPTLTFTGLSQSSTVNYYSDSTQIVTSGQYRNLIFSGTGARVFPNNGTVRISENFIVNGNTLQLNGTKIEMNGTAPQQISGNMLLDTLVINNTYLAGDAVIILSANSLVDINTKLSMVSGTLKTNGNLRLISTATQTAYITKPVTPSAQVVGNVRFQRYVGQSNMPRIVGMPVRSQTIANLNSNWLWQVYGYNESLPGPRNAGFEFLSTNDTMVTGKGYYVQYGGNNFVSEFTGSVISGTVQFPGLTWTNDPANRTASGWVMLSNPYPCAIDWMAVTGWTRSMITNGVYYMDPVTGAQASFVNGVSINGGSRYIAPGQGFWVKVTGAGASMSVTENAKVENQTRFYRQANEASLENDILRLRFRSQEITDETVVKFESGATAGFEDSLDAAKMPFMTDKTPVWMNLIVNENQPVLINALPRQIKETMSFPIETYVSKAGVATIELPSALAAGDSIEVFLLDKLEGKMINLKSQSVYSFYVNAEDASKTQSRFALILGPANANSSNSTATVQAEAIVYPNPNQGEFSLELKELKGTISLQVLNSLGAIVSENSIENDLPIANHSFNLSGLTNGVYYVVADNGTVRVTQKFIVK